MSNHYTAKVAESLKLRGWIDEIQAKALRADNARLESNLATYKAAVVEAREALIKWKAYFQADIPKNADEQEAAGEQFTDAWFDADKALHTLSALTGDATPNPLKSPSL